MAHRVRLSVVLVLLLASREASAQSASVNLALTCNALGELTATIRNVGTEDAAVIFGSVLANGRKYLVEGLILHAESDNATALAATYRFFPRSYPPGVAGRVDDWIVPLPAAASYALRLLPSDFVDNRGRLDRLPPDARISLHLPLRSARTPNADLAALKLFRVWTGSAELTSPAIVPSHDCR